MITIFWEFKNLHGIENIIYTIKTLAETRSTENARRVFQRFNNIKHTEYIESIHNANV